MLPSINVGLVQVNVVLDSIVDTGSETLTYVLIILVDYRVAYYSLHCYIIATLLYTICRVREIMVPTLKFLNKSCHQK